MRDPVEEPERPRRQMHPLPRGLVELYGLLAVLFVLVPEWMAGGVLSGFRDARDGSELPLPSMAWQRLPELQLATMGLAELRQLACRERICGYASMGRQRLTNRLLRRLSRRRRGPRTL
ncbi:hypothetical protein [Synechococcus sp. CCY 9618]|uniref:hypothetical protein n=1 Tax=Synechococcus sp. CCY 9618 TaxID=2815602 RepID=UPI00352FD019